MKNKSIIILIALMAMLFVVPLVSAATVNDVWFTGGAPSSPGLRNIGAEFTSSQNLSGSTLFYVKAAFNVSGTTLAVLAGNTSLLANVSVSYNNSANQYYYNVTGIQFNATQKYAALITNASGNVNVQFLAAAGATTGTNVNYSAGSYYSDSAGTYKLYTIAQKWGFESITSSTASPPGGVNISFTAFNYLTNATIQNFCVNITGNYSCTTTGTVNFTTILTNSTQLWTTQFLSNESPGYYSQIYTGVNVSTTNNKALEPMYLVNRTFTAYDFYTNLSLTNFSITDQFGNTTSTTSGLINASLYRVFNQSFTYNITYSSTQNGGFFNTSYTNLNVNNATNKSLSQSVISFFGLEKISGFILTNVNFTTTYLTNVTHYMYAATYNVTATKAGYFNTTQTYTAVALSNTTAFITNLSSTLYNISLQNNLTNASISNFGYTIVSNTYSWNESGTANGTNAYIYLINGSYNITFNVSGFVTTSFNVTISSGGTINQTFRVYAENSIYFYFYNASSLLPVTTQNITVALSQGSTIISNTTNASGSLFMNNLTPGNYSLEVSTTNFNRYRAFVTVGNNSFQTFNVYLVPSTSSNNAVFTVVDITTAAPIEGAVASIETQPFINSSYIFIGAVATDVTGSFNLNYVQNQNYRLTISAAGYVTKSFNLTPIISTTYQVQLTPSEPINVTDDYEGVQVIVLPNAAYSGQLFNFSYYIAAPDGNLQFFNYTVTTNYNSSIVLTGSSTNAQGGILNTSFYLINTTTPNATVIMQYEYRLSNGARFYFTRILPINPRSLASSAVNLGSGGLSLWDRILIATIVTIFFAGIITWFSNEAFGGVIAIGCFGYFIMTGFLPLWAGVISIIILFVFVAGVTAR